MRKHAPWRKSSVTSVLSVLFLFVIVMAAGCPGGQPQISIEGARAELSPAIIGEGLAYMKIVNSGGGDTLTGVKTSIPGAIVDIHEMEGERMVKVDKMSIPARSTVELKPMGSHIMIENMPKDAKEGYQFILTLTFEKSGDKQIPLTLMKAEAPMPMSHGHQM